MSDRPLPIPGLRDFAVLLALTAIVFLPGAFDARDLNFDDPFFMGPGAFAGGLRQVWDPGQTIANAYLPVSHTSLWIDNVVFGADSAGPRVHALLLHALAAFVLAGILMRIGIGRVGAILGAGLFAVHPALVESVAWVSGRKDVLSGLFVFLAISACVRVALAGEARSEAKQQSLLAIVWAVLALYSKGTAVVLPLLAAPALLFLGQPPRRHVGLLAVLTMVTVAAGLHHTSIALAEGTLVENATLGTRLAQVPGVFAHYLSTALWPTQLNVLYPEVATLDAFRDGWFLASLVLLVFVVAVFVTWRRRPRVAVGLAVFAMALAPFNTAFPASSAAAADRYLYLAIPGLALALLATSARLGPALAAVGILVCMALGLQRAEDFRNDEALWTASLEVDPENSVALFNLATVVLPDATRVAETESLLRRARECARYPAHDLRASATLMGLMAATGRIDAAVLDAERCVTALDSLPKGQASRELTRDTLLEAARHARFADRKDLADRWLARAREVCPDDPDVLAFAASAQLGTLLDGEGRVEADDPGLVAVHALLERAQAAGNSAKVYSLALAQAELAAAQGKTMAAQKHYRYAIEQINPRAVEAHLGRAQVFLSRGIYTGAESAARDGLALGLQDPRLKFLLGLALGGQGKLDQAREFYEAYLVGRPHDPAARKALSAVLSGQALRDLQTLEPERLASLADRIEDLNPENPKGFVVRAFALRHQKDLQGALLMFERAAEALPGDREIERYRVEALRDRGYQCLIAETDRESVAHDYFRRFLDAKPESLGLQVESIQNLLREAWRRHLEDGRNAFVAGDLPRAKRLVGRCLELMPGDARPRYYRGLIAFQEGENLDVAVEDFRAYVADCEQRGSDATVGVFYEVMALQRLGQNAEALARADGYLARPGIADAASKVDLTRLHAAREAAAERMAAGTTGTPPGSDTETGR